MIFPKPIDIVPQPGYIYLIRLQGIYVEEYKIGKTRDVKKRASVLRFQTGLKTRLIAYGYSSNMDISERKIQDEYYEQCIHGEYFSFNRGQIWDVLKTLHQFCDYVETDYTSPECPMDHYKLKHDWGKQLFWCEKCGYSISFDHYLTPQDRMLPYCCDELCDDYKMYINDKCSCIYN